MSIKLDPRLAAAAALTLPGQTAADVGTDHAQLAVYLVSRNICPQVIASDKAAGPWAIARDTVARAGLEEHISVRLGDGLSVLKPGEAATVILCGMGGCLIGEILAAAPGCLAATERLVLQPQKNPDVLRRWLVSHGWRIVAERVARDRGFYYVVLAAEQGLQSLSPQEAEFGPCLLRERPPLFLEELRHRKQGLETLRRQLTQTDGDEAVRRCRELAEQLRRIEEILNLTNTKGAASQC